MNSKTGKWLDKAIRTVRRKMLRVPFSEFANGALMVPLRDAEVDFFGMLIPDEYEDAFFDFVERNPSVTAGGVLDAINVTPETIFLSLVNGESLEHLEALTAPFNSLLARLDSEPETVAAELNASTERYATRVRNKEFVDHSGSNLPTERQNATYVLATHVKRAVQNGTATAAQAQYATMFND